MNTNFYVPNQSVSLQLGKSLDYQSLYKCLIEPKPPDSEDDEIYGLWDCQLRNSKYWLLLDYLSIESPGVADTTEIIEESLLNQNYKDEQLNEALLSPEDLERKFSEIDYDVIHEEVYRQKGYLSTCLKFKVSKEYARNLVRLFKSNLKAIRKNNLKYLNKKKKFGQSAVAELITFVESMKNKYFTAEQAKEYLMKRWDKLDSISLTSVRNLLKSQLNMSYKKQNLTNPKTHTLENKGRVWESIWAQIKLQEIGKQVIFLDEFKYSTHTNKFYSWSQRGKNGYLMLDLDSFQLSIIVAFSIQEIVGFWATKETVDSYKFIYFLERLNNLLKSNYVIFADNASYHKSTVVRKFLEIYKIQLITIPGYWPYLNPAEKLILQLKSKMKLFHKNNKITNMNKVKKILDDMNQNNLNKWVIDSRKETLEIIRQWI